MKIDISEHFDLKKLLRYCLSPISMMVFSSLYSVVDGIMVSNAVGKNAMAAVNIIWPMVMIIGSVGFMIGAGGSAQIGKTMGENKPQKACEIFTFLVLSIVVAGVVLSTLAIVNIERLSYLFGSNELLLPQCRQYGVAILSFTTMFMIQSAFQNYCATSGKPVVGFISTIASGIVNIVLDYLFIVVFDMGILGAGVATGLGYTVGAIIPLVYYLLPNGSSLRFCKTGFYFKELFYSCSNGISEMLTNVSASFVAALFNVRIMSLIGENGVAAYSIISYTDYVFKAILLGISIAVAPIISYNYGSKNMAELKNVYRMALKMIFFCSILMFVIPQLSADLIADIFVSNDEELLLLTAKAMRIYGLGYFFCGINIFASGFFTALCNGKLSALISSIRSFIIPILAISILSYLFGIDGIWLTIPISEIITFIFSVVLILINGKDYGYR
ncbi:MAG: MATE family efflux transporter [Erysipelotrichaceae bacterium]